MEILTLMPKEVTDNIQFSQVCLGKLCIGKTIAKEILDSKGTVELYSNGEVNWDTGEFNCYEEDIPYYRIIVYKD